MVEWRNLPGTVVLAHRGAAHAAPENTLAAFALALSEGADGIEFDVHRTADGHLVVLHDEVVDRTTNGFGPVSQMTLEQVRSLDAGSWFDPRFAGEKVPLLEEVLELARGHLLVDIELKTSGIEAQVVETVRKFRMAPSVLISSFSREAISAVKEIAPEIAVGLLSLHGDPSEALSLGVQVFLPSVGVLSKDCVESCHRQGISVVTWTILTEQDAREAIRLGVEGIIADDPVMARRALEEERNR
ncbi:MAG: glycerophosphodiester phosphodiesterase family protein [Armatimonadota bacterium]|nr:glycerophosphodiester phosphodiesterase family protein [Armatimonadota bacterium]